MSLSLLFQVISEGQGELAVARRPDEQAVASLYAPCGFCLVFCHKKTLSTHMSRCTLKLPGANINRKCFEDGILLVETYLPKLRPLEQKVEEIFTGMKDTSANKGETASSLCILYLPSENFSVHLLLFKNILTH